MTLQHQKQSLGGAKVASPGTAFCLSVFPPKPVFPADEHFFGGTGRYQGWQELSDYQLFGSFTVTVEVAEEYLHSLFKTQPGHCFQSFQVNLYI